MSTKKIQILNGASIIPKPDWNQTDDTKADYIKNRPFYEDTLVDITWDGDTTGKISVADVYYHVSADTPSPEELVGITLSVYDNGTVSSIVIPDGMIVSGENYAICCYVEDFVIVTYADNVAVNDRIFPAKGVYFQKAEVSGGYMYVSAIQKTTIKKLDSKFLDMPQASPDALGGVKADAAETADTQPVRIGGDGKLYTAPGGGGADISLGISGATAGQMAKVKAVDASGAPTAWEAGDAAGGYDIDLSREPDLVIDVTEDINPSISISEIDGVSIDASKMAVLLEYPSGAEYTPNYVRFNNVVKNSTDSSSALANANVQKFTNASTSGALLIKANKINDGTYLLEYKYLMQNPGTITGYANTVYAMIYRNAIVGETSIKELYIYQNATIKAGSKISIWVG